MPSSPVNLANIENAAQLIDPVFLHIPQYEDAALNTSLGQRVLRTSYLAPAMSYSPACVARGFLPAKCLASIGDLGKWSGDLDGIFSKV